MQGNQRFQAGISQGGRQNAGRGGQGGGRAGRTQTQIRTTVRVGFEYAPTTGTGVSSKLQARLAQSSRIQFLSPVEVALNGPTATLRGVVASEHSRALAEQLARLEPGIWSVQNELEVVAPASASEPSLVPSLAPAPLPPIPPSP
jgi:osmotically-inducible protein OsmY